jgi:hypothetical protein
MGQATKVDPIKNHREGTALYDAGNYKEALDKFSRARARIASTTVSSDFRRFYSD